MTSDHSPPSGNPSNGQRASALFSIPAHVRLWFVAALALTADLWTKHWAFQTLGPGDVRHAIPNLLTLRRSLNAGALFGIGQGMVPIFIVASFIALAFVVYMFWSSRRGQFFLHLALSFVLAGSLGNLYDRIFIRADRITIRDPATGDERTDIGMIVDDSHDTDTVVVGAAPDGAHPRRIDRSTVINVQQVGVVRDFLKIEPQVAGRDVWPWVFNVADALLTTGVIILLLTFFVEHRRMAHLRAGESAACEST